jgi:AGZA family xanthine/uracil permease-like MFS transporter
MHSCAHTFDEVGVMSALAQYFDLAGRGTTAGRELRGAVATFLTMAYILFANPNILKGAGVPFEPAVAATALAAGICCILMGVVANFPVALASGMGLNAVVAYQVAVKAGSWQAAMGIIVLDGIVVLALVLTGLREAVMHAIPRNLRLAIGAGIGLFIAFIGFAHAGIVIKGIPLVTYGPIIEFGKNARYDTIVAIFGLLLTAVLLARRVNGAFIIGILASTALALILGVAELPRKFGLPSFETLFKADIGGALRWNLMPLLFAVILVDFFDTLGTVTGLAHQADLQDDTGRIPALRNILIVDSASASIGGLCGASSVTCYIESASGIAEGARTGLHSVFVGLMFLLAVFLAPLASIVPPAATAPALILVGFLMIAQIALIDFGDLEISIPAFITLMVIPLTWSISHGIGYGFITFVVMKLARGKVREVHPLMYAVAAAFAAYFVLDPVLAK